MLGISGGRDSMVLWHRLRNHDGPLIIVHGDHALRRESGADADWLAQGFRAWARPADRFIRRRWARGSDQSGSEDQARRWRYRLLCTVAREHEAAIAVAHHGDDQIETVVHNLLRGSGPVGAAGMPVSRRLTDDTLLLRPLLDWRRTTIDAYAHAHGIDWREDASNRDRRIRRNLLRHAVLPTFELVPGFGEAVLTHARAARERTQILDRWLQAFWQNHARGRRLRLPRSRDPGILADRDHRWHLWRHLLRHLDCPHDRVHLGQLDHLWTSGRGTSWSARGRWLRRTRGGLVWCTGS